MHSARSPMERRLLLLLAIFLIARLVLSPRKPAYVNAFGYNEFAGAFATSTSESYSSSTTPATMATSAMLNTYQ